MLVRRIRLWMALIPAARSRGSPRRITPRGTRLSVAGELLLDVLGDLGELAPEALLGDTDGVLVAGPERLCHLLGHRRLHVRRQGSDLRIGHELEEDGFVRSERTIPGRSDV